MSDVDRIADALFDRFRRLVVSALAQPLDAGGLVVAEIAHTESGATISKWIDVYDALLQERGYDPQTLKNRRANLKHVR